MKVRKLLFALLLILKMITPSAVFSQENQNQTISEVNNSIFDAAELYENEQYEVSYNLYIQIIKKAKKIKYSKGIAEASIGAAQNLFVLGKLDQSTVFLLSVENEPYAKKNPEVMSRIYFQIALNLHALHSNEALKTYHLSNSFAQKIKNINQKNDRITKVLNNIGDIYQIQENYDSAIYYYYKGFHHPSQNFKTKLISSLSLVDIYIIKNQMDSARKYIELSNKYLKYINSKNYTAITQRTNGTYHHALGNYKEAIKFYKKAIALNDKINVLDSYLYELQAKSFAKLNETDSANYYLQKYLYLKEKNRLSLINNNKVPLIILESEKVQTIQKNNRRYLWIFSGSLVVISLALFIFLKQKSKIYRESQENRSLKKQLNGTYDEIVELAKNNSPNFLPRFIEVYPEFHKKLMQIQPDLTNSDLILSAYLKLDFSTKEIAHHAFFSIRTVQNKKYRLRKKLNLDSKTDLAIWMQNLNNKSNEI